MKLLCNGLAYITEQCVSPRQLNHCSTPLVPTDGAVVTIIPSAVTVTENKGTASVRVVRVGDTTQALTLNFLTVPNSPAPGISTGMYLIINGWFVAVLGSATGMYICINTVW